MASRAIRHQESSYSSSSNVVRSLRPSRPLSPPHKNIELNNNNLDHLLDDLKTTVNRTTEHLNSANSSKRHDVQFLSPSNTTTIVEERSSSPSGENGKMYKSSRYEYSSSSSTRDGKIFVQPKSYESVEQTNINQLDNLLDDLKQERDYSYDKDAIDSDLLDPNSLTSKTSPTVTKTTTRSKNVSRELKFDSSVYDISPTHQRIRSPNYQEHIESQILRDVKYDTEPVEDITSNSTLERSNNHEKNTLFSPNLTPYNTKIVEMDTTDLPIELKDAPISNDLLPGPGTKVRTTIKTFTYEIPNDTMVPTNKNFTYKNEYYNSLNSSNSYYPEPPQATKTTTSYTNELNNTFNRTSENIYPPMNPDSHGPNQTFFYKKEVDEMKNNIYGRPRSPAPISTNMKISLHEENIKNKRDVFHPTGGIPVYPNNASLPAHQPTGQKQTYIYKKETTNTSNTMYGAPRGSEPLPHDRYVSEPQPSMLLPTSSTTTTTNEQTRTEHEASLAPFPTDDIRHPQVEQVDGPPKHLDQLLASFDENTSRSHEEPYIARKEVNTALSTNEGKPVIEPKSPTKNIAGPPVYYPPGQELFAKSEAQAALRAKGGWAKGSGKYEYEAESKSKSSSKSGAAVVPVCLPLCCAMPCSIM